MKFLKFTFFFILPIAAILAVGLVVDGIFGKGMFGFIYALTVYIIIGILSISFVIIPVALVPTLKKYLGPESNHLVTPQRIKVWISLSQLYRFMEATEDELHSIARDLHREKISIHDVKRIMETEIAPACLRQSLAVGDDYYDGIDDWTKNEKCLSNRILSGCRAYRVIRSFPIFGYVWAKGLAISYNKKLVIVLSELEALKVAEV